MSSKIVYFISGHCDMDEKEFLQRYQTRLDTALSQNAAFVVGDARGVDQLAQQYLSGKTNKVTIYHIGEKPRFNIGSFPTMGGFPSHNAKDKAMTLASTHDLAWVRSEEEQKAIYGDQYKPRISGTQRNLQRRLKLQKKSNLKKC